jgi:hypothetical protein
MGYDFVIPDHIMTMMKPVCLHRLYLREKGYFKNLPDLLETRLIMTELDLIRKAFDCVPMPI